MGARARRGRAAAARARAAASSPRSPAPRRSSRRTRSASSLRVGLDSHQAMLPEEVSGALDAYRLPLSAIRDADVVVVLGDVPVVERAPVVDLWVERRAATARRIVDDANDPASARPSASSSSGRAPAAAAARRVAQLAEKLGLAGREGCGAFYLPADAERPRRRRRLGRVLRRGGARRRTRSACSSSRATRPPANPNVRALAEQAEATIVDLDVRRARRRLGRPRPAGHELPRARRHVRQPRGPPAAAAPHGRRRPAPTSSSGSRSSPRASTSTSRRTRRASSPRSRRRVYGGLSFGEVGERAPLRGYPDAPDARRRARRCRSRSRSRGEGRSGSSRTSRSSPAPPSSASRSSSSSGRSPRSSSRPSDATRRGIATGDLVTVGTNGSAITLPARVNRRLRAGIARVALEHAERPRRHRRGREGARRWSSA